MNEFTMGPLDARKKPSKKGEGFVFLCGARVCPEILAFDLADEQGFQISASYDRTSKSVWIKTRRAGNRDSQAREGFAVLDERNRVLGFSEHEDMIELSTTTRVVAASTVRDRVMPASVDENAFPLLFRCARCGRESKIDIASTEAFQFQTVPSGAIKDAALPSLALPQPRPFRVPHDIIDFDDDLD